MLSPSGRKQKRKAGTYSRNVAKAARYSGERKAPCIALNHVNSEKVCRASAPSTTELTLINPALYSTTDEEKQDASLLSYMDTKPVKRRRPTVDNPAEHKTRDLTVKCFVLNEAGKIPVCKASFMSLFG